jgi:hypothetical protein
VLLDDIGDVLIDQLELVSSLDREAGALEALRVVLSFADILKEIQAQLRGLLLIQSVRMRKRESTSV